MKTSNQGVELIKSWEGLELEAYQDIAGVWTIGYGATGDGIGPGLIWTEADAEARLRADLASREDAVTRFITAPLDQNAFDALVSLVYNIGIEAFRSSTVRTRINNGDTDERVAEAWGWWNKATVNGVKREVTGLTVRRAEEIALYMKPSAKHEAPLSTEGILEAPGIKVEPESRPFNPRAFTPPETEPLRVFLRGVISYFLKGRP